MGVRCSKNAASLVSDAVRQLPMIPFTRSLTADCNCKVPAGLRTYDHRFNLNFSIVTLVHYAELPKIASVTILRWTTCQLRTHAAAILIRAFCRPRNRKSASLVRVVPATLSWILFRSRSSHVSFGVGDRRSGHRHNFPGHRTIILKLNPSIIPLEPEKESSNFQTRKL